MSKHYYLNPHRRVGSGRGAPNKIEDEPLLDYLALAGPVTVVQVAARFGCSRSAAYYRLRAMETESAVAREPGENRFDWWRIVDA